MVLGLHAVEQGTVDADAGEHRPDVGVLALVVVGEFGAEVGVGPLERLRAGGVALRQLRERGRQPGQVPAHGAVDDAVHREVRPCHARGR
jgi:hypothetical protein